MRGKWLAVWGVLVVLVAVGTAVSQPGGLAIQQVTTNLGDYPGSFVPQYAKLELRFQVVNSVAGNTFLPYDPAPPAGIDPAYAGHQGISVDALFLPPGERDWARAFRQPAFFHAAFAHEIRPDANGTRREWAYPTGETAWAVRFAPHRPGLWLVKLVARDAGGAAESAPLPISVVPSADPGFVRVSPGDPRYFAFDDGRLFWGQGFHQAANLGEPVRKNEANFRMYRANGITLLRVWVSQLYGTAWLDYLGGRNQYNGYLPRPGVLPFFDAASGRTTLALRLDYEADGGDSGWFDACRYQFWDDPTAVRPGTRYRIQVRYRGVGIVGPREAGQADYGLVVKLGGAHPNCHEPGVGLVVTGYGRDNAGWGVIEGEWESGAHNFLPRLHLALENVRAGQAYVDAISVREVLAGGQLGPEVLPESWLQYELTVSAAEADAMDRLVALASAHGVYLKLVVMEKLDPIYLKLADDGSFILEGADNADGFYGVGRTVNKTRWLQQAWWRYLQARWGYATSVHSWELVNEGDPANADHYALADEFGKYMHCGVFGVAVAADGARCDYDHPNDHLVTTSFWHSFPAAAFWGSAAYPHVDYADVHAYISTGWLDDPAHEADTAAYHLDYSAALRQALDAAAARAGMPTRPIVRGEAGIDFVGAQVEQPDLARDAAGVWLHNLLWATLDGGALTELYWLQPPAWGSGIVGQPGMDGAPGLYDRYRAVAAFVDGLMLQNGRYRPLEADGTAGLRVVGQMDAAAQRAHLWIQNRAHTWRRVVDGTAVAAVDGQVVVRGFTAGARYQVVWWDTAAGRPLRAEMVTGTAVGELVLPVSGLAADVAVKIEPAWAGLPTPAADSLGGAAAWAGRAAAALAAGFGW